MTEILGLTEYQSDEYFRTGKIPQEANRPTVRNVIAVDVGQATDPSAIIVGTYDTKHPIPRPLTVGHAERVALGTAYQVIATYLSSMINAPPLTPRNTDLAIDGTGIGRAVAEMIEREGVKVTRIVFTAGAEAREVKPRSWTVPKMDLVSALAVKLTTETLYFAEGIRDRDLLREELESFQLKARRTGLSFDAEAGAKDDMVDALSIAAWFSDYGYRKPTRVL